MSNQPALPQITHVYQNHSIDSTRWDHFQPRDGDVVVVTSLKSGTTWMTNIVLQLIFAGNPPVTIGDVVPWLELVTNPIDDIIEKLEAQEHRRIIKCHLPLDGLRYFERCRYILIGRDPRDVFMSFWNHYSHERPESIAEQNTIPGRVGPPLPDCPPTLQDLWRRWINEGWFEWEEEGWPYSANMGTYQTWWPYRHLENIQLFHFNDLLSDLPGQIAKVARFLDIATNEKLISEIAAAVSFEATKKNAGKMGFATEEVMNQMFDGGADRFFYKGTNGRWRGVLTEEELAMYEYRRDRVLTPDCARWLEQGAAALNGGEHE